MFKVLVVVVSTSPSAYTFQKGFQNKNLLSCYVLFYLMKLMSLSSTIQMKQKGMYIYIYI